MKKTLLLLTTLVFSLQALAEGSKDLFKKGQQGYRAHLLARGNSAASANHDPFPSSGVHKVYAKAGECIYAGSSVGRDSLIRLIHPNGNRLTWNNATTYGAGMIDTRQKELAGPRTNSNPNGYTALKYTVTTEGIYEVQFLNTTNASTATANFTSLNTLDLLKISAETFKQESETSTANGLIAAWDVSVGSANNHDQIINGRVYLPSLNLTGYNKEFDRPYLYSKLYVLTPQAYVYEVDNNGNNGASFNFFSNNKGIINTTNGQPTYKSLNSINIAGNTIDPRKPDNGDGANFTNKIFYNQPDLANFPDTAVVSYSYESLSNKKTWLKGALVTPELTDVYITCDGKVVFNSNMVGRYQILIDLNDNGIHDNGDLFLSGPTVIGRNQVALISNNQKTINDIITSSIKLSVKTTTAEVHFPFADMESNLNGIKIKRLGATTGGDIVYWDNSNITGVTAPNPNKVLEGLSSANGANKWGVTTSKQEEPQFGNDKVIDTWTFVYDMYETDINRYECLTYSGNIWNDVNIDGKINNGEQLVAGTTGNALNTLYTGTPLYVYAINDDGIIIDKVQVSASGSYSFSKLPSNTRLRLSVSSDDYAIGISNIITSLPINWDYVSYNNGRPILHHANTIEITTTRNNVNNFHIGIYKVPVVGSGLEKLKDDGGASYVTIPSTSFVNVSTTNPGNTDIEYKILTKFPMNTTSISINNQVYTEANFPTQGVRIATDKLGIPVIPISINPDFEGKGEIVLNLKAYDIKNKASKNTGEVIIKFGAKITGNVWNDGNGDLNKNNNEPNIPGDGNSTSNKALSTQEPLFVYVTDKTTNRILYKSQVDSNGTYTIEDIYDDDALNVILTISNLVVGNIYTTPSLPSGWDAIGIDYNGNPIPTSKLTFDVNSLSNHIINLNFGLQQRPLAFSYISTLVNNPKEFDIFKFDNSVVTTSGFLPIIEGTDAETPADQLMFKITGLPYTIDGIQNTIRVPAVLMYDGLVLDTTNLDNIVIPNFDASLLSIQLIGSGYDNVVFDYVFIDEAKSSSLVASYYFGWTSALPLDLVSFKVTYKNDDIALEWITNNEDNVSHFDIEYSLNNANWNSIGQVQAKDTMGINQYTFLHQPEASGTHLYRLKMVDIGGQYKYSTTKRIVTNQGVSIKAFPNPATDMITVKGVSAYDQCSVIDVNGKVVLQQSINTDHIQIDLTRFAKGQYIIQLNDQHNNVEYIKFMVK